MSITANGLDLLRVLASVRDYGIENADLRYDGFSVRELVQLGFAKTRGENRLFITEEGLEELRGLPEFDEPTSPPAPLLEARGEEQSVDLPEMMASAAVSVHEFVQRVAEMNAEISPDERQAEYIQRLADLQQAMDMNDKLIKLVIVDGLELHNFVEHCGSEITAMGGTVIKLELKEALLREVFPPLVKYLEGLDAIGAEYAVFGDLQIVVEQPIDRANELIGFELK
jgi:hypothetical protein